VRVSVHRVSHVSDFAVQPYEKAHPFRHWPGWHFHPVSVSNFPVRISQERKIQIILGNELLMALWRVKTHADNFDVILLEIRDAIAKTARFFRTTRRIVLRIEIEQHDLLADFIRQFPGLSVLVFTLDEWRFVADFRRLSRHSEAEHAGADTSSQNKL